jgi:hypothetical protein
MTNKLQKLIIFNFNKLPNVAYIVKQFIISKFQLRNLQT